MIDISCKNFWVEAKFLSNMQRFDCSSSFIRSSFAIFAVNRYHGVKYECFMEFSTIIDYCETLTLLIDEQILGESSEFPMSSISIPSSPSSITTFFLKGCLLQLKHKFFENKTRKIRNKSISARVVSSISFHIYLFPFVSFSSIEKILTEVN